MTFVIVSDDTNSISNELIRLCCFDNFEMLQITSPPIRTPIKTLVNPLYSNCCAIFLAVFSTSFITFTIVFAIKTK